MISEREWHLEGLYLTHYTGSTDEFVILAPPLFEEMPRTSKAMVNFARRLSAKGPHCIRFDYFGTGLSEGSSEEFSLEVSRANLETVIAYASSIGARRISLLGFRFGGYLVQEFASRPEIAKAILWEPLTDLAGYFSEMLRITIANQMLMFGHVQQNSRQLTELLEQGRSVSLVGYPTSPKTYQEFKSAPEGFGQAGFDRAKVTILLWESKRLLAGLLKQGLDVTWIDGNQLSWQNIRYLEPSPEALFEESESRIFSR
jgi:alpha/beta superfamily hydrolase